VSKLGHARAAADLGETPSPSQPLANQPIVLGSAGLGVPTPEVEFVAAKSDHGLPADW